MRRSATLAHFSLIVGLFALTACSSDPSVAVDTTGAGGSTLPPATGEPAGTQTFTDLEQTHVDTPVNFPQTPPVGGPHSPAWQTCAFYDTAVPNERGVHSMEHGAVWITYSPDLDAAQVAVLKTRTGFDVTFRNSAGTAISRTFDYQAIGFGRERST